ncbi:hypothetical protein Cadr_000018046 [Camelus dromedarius]|uniref:Uncharacterized protein n=1 Tax=Camelus dromedarius TaxID=9838 RepID=A0A5N4D6X5_CAMDR|nr:hypothetical protein Cadr_000018046 [Camelus dromedarius]
MTAEGHATQPSKSMTRLGVRSPWSLDLAPDTKNPRLLCSRQSMLPGEHLRETWRAGQDLPRVRHGIMGTWAEVQLRKVRVDGQGAGVRGTQLPGVSTQARGCRNY